MATMTSTIPKKDFEYYQDLKAKLIRWSDLYYVESKPEVSDEVYDASLRELIELEAKHPELISEDSPSQQVGAEERKSSKFEKLKHKVPMISLANAFGEEEIREWEERINRIIGEETSREYVFELKIDGVSIALDYNQGLLIRASTRGNGKVGEDITANVKTIKSIPQKIKHQEPLSIRGEAFISKKSFAKINEEQEAKGAMIYANPRNTASGSLRQLDPKVTANRNLDAFLYQVFNFNALSPLKDSTEEIAIEDAKSNFKTHSESLDMIQDLGFKLNTEHNKVCKNIEEVIQLYKSWEEKKSSLDYQIDGAVVKINQLNLQKTLGSTAKSPRWAIALKFKAEVAETRVESITNEVGRTGAITPVANLLPVQLAGTTVKRASLHNFDIVEKLDVRIGDFVKVHKAGEIIPEILSVDISKREANPAKITAPKNCPVCGSDVVKEEVAIKCSNIAGCPTQVQRRIEHWCSKSAMGIAGIGPSLIEQLLEKEMIETPLDLYKLSKEDFAGLERMADKSAQNAIDSLEASKDRSFSRFLHALGIKHVGVNVAELIADFFPDLASLEQECLENNGTELQKIDGLGPKIVESLIEYLNSDIAQKLLADLKANPSLLNIQRQEKKQLGDKLSGSSFVITGTLSESRSHYEKLIKENGGKVSSSVSKKTSYLLCGEAAGSKLDKANNLGVKVLNEEEFNKLLHS